MLSKKRLDEIYNPRAIGDESKKAEPIVDKTGRIKSMIDLNSDQIFLGMVSMQYKAKTVRRALLLTLCLYTQEIAFIRNWPSFFIEENIANHFNFKLKKIV